jgi:hypothetical protein
MAITYPYVDPKDMTAFRLITPGEGKFRITKVEEGKSRANDPMMTITMKLQNTHGESTMFKDYIVQSREESVGKMAATKVYNILNAIGRSDLYGQPLEPKHVMGGQGKCIIQTKKSNDPKYKDSSEVGQYVSLAEAQEMDAARAKESSESGDFDDEIPF